MKKLALVTGSAGLVGSECVRFFSQKGFGVIGVDNNMRKNFFGAAASVEWNKDRLLKTAPDYVHYDFDIRDKAAIEGLFIKYNFDLIIHAAAQPSHDWAAKEPTTDFDINAGGTLASVRDLAVMADVQRARSVINNDDAAAFDKLHAEVAAAFDAIDKEIAR